MRYACLIDRYRMTEPAMANRRSPRGVAPSMLSTPAAAHASASVPATGAAVEGDAQSPVQARASRRALLTVGVATVAAAAGATLLSTPEPADARTITAQGGTGPRGATGAAGAPGANGAAGTPAAVGPTGPDGRTGAPYVTAVKASFPLHPASITEASIPDMGSTQSTGSWAAYSFPLGTFGPDVTTGQVIDVEFFMPGMSPTGPERARAAPGELAPLSRHRAHSVPHCSPASPERPATHAQSSGSIPATCASEPLPTAHDLRMWPAARTAPCNTGLSVTDCNDRDWTPHARSQAPAGHTPHPPRTRYRPTGDASSG